MRGRIVYRYRCGGGRRGELYIDTDVGEVGRDNCIYAGYPITFYYIEVHIYMVLNTFCIRRCERGT